MKDAVPGPAADRSRSRRPAEMLDWLAALFAAPPTVEFVASHRRGPGADLLRDLARDPDLAHGAALLREALAGADDDRALAARLGRSFGLLFEGVGGPDTVPPYESAFRQGSAWRLFQAPTGEMEALLAERDLSVSPAAAMPADHLAVELALTAHLVATGDDESAEAMIRRLAGWTPAFADACGVADGEGFWAGAAILLAAVTASGNFTSNPSQSTASA
ncbi:TorA-specific chaperone [Roseiarcus fermentans]|uniref:TorA-specific chaperone n=1 Tax=Roseiarcus fermentans TaxID=1473586 RepID=A0A366FHP2_9HYPH|nr:molecular chaperone TorD family protein [Roseiarcus fermentans]RBP14127.1 TorA-specific chaperone [Roseiarcus fermentans]